MTLDWVLHIHHGFALFFSYKTEVLVMMDKTTWFSLGAPGSRPWKKDCSLSRIQSKHWEVGQGQKPANKNCHCGLLEFNANEGTLGTSIEHVFQSHLIQEVSEVRYLCTNSCQSCIKCCSWRSLISSTFSLCHRTKCFQWSENAHRQRHVGAELVEAWTCLSFSSLRTSLYFMTN